MSTHDHLHDANPMSPSSKKRDTLLARPVRTTLLMAALVGGFYLLREHWNHIIGSWVYLLLLACPLMHLFHGHGGHGHGSRSDAQKR